MRDLGGEINGGDYDLSFSIVYLLIYHLKIIHQENFGHVVFTLAL